jgi:hypothetical protein
MIGEHIRPTKTGADRAIADYSEVIRLDPKNRRPRQLAGATRTTPRAKRFPDWEPLHE